MSMDVLWLSYDTSMYTLWPSYDMSMDVLWLSYDTSMYTLWPSYDMSMDVLWLSYDTSMGHTLVTITRLFAIYHSNYETMFPLL